MNRIIPVLMLSLGFVVGTSIGIAYANGVITFDGDTHTTGSARVGGDLQVDGATRMFGTAGLEGASIGILQVRDGLIIPSGSITKSNLAPGAINLEPIQKYTTALNFDPADLETIPGLSHTFTVSSTATVFVFGTVDIEAFFEGQHLEIGVMVDGNIKQLGSPSGAPLLLRAPAYVNWVGTLAPGTHTIEITSTDNTSGIRTCPESLVYCHMEILIFD